MNLLPIIVELFLTVAVLCALTVQADHVVDGCSGPIEITGASGNIRVSNCNRNIFIRDCFDVTQIAVELISHGSIAINNIGCTPNQQRPCIGVSTITYSTSIRITNVFYTGAGLTSSPGVIDVASVSGPPGGGLDIYISNVDVKSTADETFHLISVRASANINRISVSNVSVQSTTSSTIQTAVYFYDLVGAASGSPNIKIKSISIKSIYQATLCRLENINNFSSIFIQDLAIRDAPLSNRNNNDIQGVVLADVQTVVRISTVVLANVKSADVVHVGRCYCLFIEDVAFSGTGSDSSVYVAVVKFWPEILFFVSKCTVNAVDYATLVLVVFGLSSATRNFRMLVLSNAINSDGGVVSYFSEPPSHTTFIGNNLTVNSVQYWRFQSSNSIVGYFVGFLLAGEGVHFLFTHVAKENISVSEGNDLAFENFEIRSDHGASKAELGMRGSDFIDRSFVLSGAVLDFVEEVRVAVDAGAFPITGHLRTKQKVKERFRLFLVRVIAPAIPLDLLAELLLRK